MRKVTNRVIEQILRAVTIPYLIFVVVTFSHTASAEGLIDDIRQSGRLVVGVKADYPPWGMLSSSGEHIGFEADLARAVATAIGRTPDDVQVVFKTVSSSNRFRKLNDKEVDILIATVGDTSQRRLQVNMVQPHYFQSGVRALMKNDSSVKQWSDLIGQPVCLTAGAYFNKSLVQSYRIKPVIMMSNRDAQLALLTHKCVAWAYDSGVLYHLASQPEWANYRLGLTTILPIYWSIVTRHDPESTALSDFLSGFLQAQIRTGNLLALADKWALPEHDFLLQLQHKWQEKDALGEWICQISSGQEDGNQSCLDMPMQFESQHYSSIWPLDYFDTQRLIESLLHTGFFTLLAVLLALLCAVFFSLLTLYSPWRLGHLVAVLTHLQSFVPPILMLYLVYFGALPYWAYLDHTSWFNGVAVSLLVLSLYTAAGINNLVTASLPARVSLLSLYLHHQLGVRANLVNLAKAAGMASVLASPNAVLVINSLVASSGNPILLMTLLALFYYVEVMLFAALINYVLGYLQRPSSASNKRALIQVQGDQ